ncbi:hypothetical protein BRD17_03265 [Halobacteriales archaeon SW_7_68_16]|nr:MAG: hypothetical protein BRD17_03265 [Halobacteriales archaeon SW_7_68_16]
MYDGYDAVRHASGDAPTRVESTRPWGVRDPVPGQVPRQVAGRDDPDRISPSTTGFSLCFSRRRLAASRIGSSGVIVATGTDITRPAA